ncbi:DUF1361 domain-containing protein [Paenibacillus hemerocallicola]|uniref:DUF1361 domain-containing protein n=1 Tax=Paenibacillus hemerocallicola TaxID=1172614 RepID=UPI00159EC522|nr:DUF1361 domain-containing protein [Paenibacillus hemerocallicola]
MEQRLSRSAVWALAAASVLCALMVGMRIVYMDKWTYYWLVVPNLLLAWIPLMASSFACRTIEDGRKPGIATAAWGIVWLAFYPNASYIATDLIHLSYASTKETLYYDLSVNMLAAMLGWLLGAISLYGLHAEMVRRSGARVGTAFAAIVILLGSVGVYLGRVLRWNSWDLVIRPWQIVTDTLEAIREPDALLFIGAFALFTGAVYAVFYKLVHRSSPLLRHDGSL